MLPTAVLALLQKCRFNEEKCTKFYANLQALWNSSHEVCIRPPALAVTAMMDTRASLVFLKMLQSTFIFPHKVIFFLFAHTVIHRISQQTFVYMWWFWEGWRGVEFLFFFSSFVFIISYHSVKTIFVGFIFFFKQRSLRIFNNFSCKRKAKEFSGGGGDSKTHSFQKFFLRREGLWFDFYTRGGFRLGNNNWRGTQQVFLIFLFQTFISSFAIRAVVAREIRNSKDK